MIASGEDGLCPAEPIAGGFGNPPRVPNTMPHQQLLFLAVANPNPTSPVVAWSHFDGSGQTHAMAGDSDSPPYETVLDAMRDGWRVLQAPQLMPAGPGQEHETAFLKFEYVLERLVEVRGHRHG
jgi:hypothetical protein